MNIAGEKLTLITLITQDNLYMTNFVSNMKTV